MKLKKHPTYLKWRYWEFWPFYILYIPIFAYWSWVALRARSLLFFTAVNPGIEGGGISGESKWKIYENLPKDFIPNTVFIKSGTCNETIKKTFEEAGLAFPVFVKPNVGKRGRLVSKLNNWKALFAYAKHPIDFLIQEFADHLHEYSVYYIRHPENPHGEVLSLTWKEHLRVVGNGKSTVYELLQERRQGLMWMKEIKVNHADKLDYMPKDGEVVKFSDIGNHARGSTFHNRNHLIDDQLRDAFDQVFTYLVGIHVCRFDIKCNSIKELKQLHNFKIIEINGVGGELAHIYDKDYSLWQAYKDNFYLWEQVLAISRANKILGIQEASLAEGLAYLWRYRNYRKLLGDLMKT